MTGTPDPDDLKILGWVCSNCGFSLYNRPMWCSLGCGRDYSRMDEIDLIDRSALGPETLDSLYPYQLSDSSEDRQRLAALMAAPDTEWETTNLRARYGSGWCPCMKHRGEAGCDCSEVADSG